MHLGEVKYRYEEIRRLGGQVLVVSFSPPAALVPYLERTPLPFPVVSDTARAAYWAFELGRTSWRKMLRPKVLARFLKLLLRNRLPRQPYGGEDVWQLGGDFILDGRHRLVYAHPSKDPTDRPAAEELVQAVRKAVY